MLGKGQDLHLLDLLNLRVHDWMFYLFGLDYLFGCDSKAPRADPCLLLTFHHARRRRRFQIPAGLRQRVGRNMARLAS